MPPQLSRDTLSQFADLILRRTGMTFERRRYDALARGLRGAAADMGCERLGDLYHRLEGTTTDDELWDGLMRRLCVGETYFFRNETHIEALRTRILPDLVARRRGTRRLRIWSAGCASGEEPYSLAILLREMLPDVDDWNILMLGTDINREALERAQRATYTEWSFRNCDPALRQRHFIQDDGHWRVRPDTEALVTWSYLNLAEDVYPSLPTNTNAMDLIVCRNVFMYLSSATMRGTIEKFFRCLVPGGWLMVGSVDASSEFYELFDRQVIEGAIAYQKPTETRSRHARPSTAPARRTRARPAKPAPRLARPQPSAVVPVSEKPSDVFDEGLVLAEQGCFESAVSRFLAYLERRPRCPRARYQIARMMANTGRLEEAQQWADQAIERDPLLTEAHYTLALIHQEKGELPEALTQLKKTLYLSPDFVMAHFSSASLYRELNRPELAKRHRAQATRLAAKMAPNEPVPGAEGMTAGRLLTMIQATL